MSNELFDSLFERARSAAFASDARHRGWEAVRTAALLRQEGELETALELLDDVAAHFQYEDVVRAAFTCAVAIHCDRGRPEIGVMVGRPLWDRQTSPELGNALVRAYWDRFERTGDLDDRDAWLTFKDELDMAISAAA